MRRFSVKNPSRLDDFEIRRFTSILKCLREEALRSLKHLNMETRSPDSRSSQDIGDAGTELFRENLFQETDRRQTAVRLMDAALIRIQQGKFGVCVVCGGNINRWRLQAVPWSPHCLRCQEVIEKEPQTAGFSGERAGSRFTLRNAG